MRNHNRNNSGGIAKLVRFFRRGNPTRSYVPVPFEPRTHHCRSWMPYPWTRRLTALTSIATHTAQETCTSMM